MKERRICGHFGPRYIFDGVTGCKPCMGAAILAGVIPVAR